MLEKFRLSLLQAVGCAEIPVFSKPGNLPVALLGYLMTHTLQTRLRCNALTSTVSRSSTGRFLMNTWTHGCATLPQFVSCPKLRAFPAGERLAITGALFSQDSEWV